MTIDPLHTQHERLFDDGRFVYPVLSRRSGGISVGVNLNPTRSATSSCVYCQVNRVSQSETRFVATEQLLAPWRSLVGTGDVRATVHNRQDSATRRSRTARLTDIAFSGDGEPTTASQL